MIYTLACYLQTIWVQVHKGGETEMLKKIMKKLKEQGGFTLAELVVTTAVMGTLAAVAIPRFSDVNEIAKAKRRSRLSITSSRQPIVSIMRKL